MMRASPRGLSPSPSRCSSARWQPAQARTPSGCHSPTRATSSCRARLSPSCPFSTCLPWLPGAPELMTIDPQAGRAFVAINDQDAAAAIDLGSLQVTSIYKGCDIKAPTGMSYDPAQARLFVADRALVSVIDVLVDRCLGSVDIGNGVDQITINPHNHHLYTAKGGSRNLSVIDIVSLQPLGEQGTGPSGDGVAADPTTNTVYVIVGRAGIIASYHDP